MSKSTWNYDPHSHLLLLHLLHGMTRLTFNDPFTWCDSDCDKVFLLWTILLMFRNAFWDDIFASYGRPAIAVVLASGFGYQFAVFCNAPRFCPPTPNMLCNVLMRCKKMWCISRICDALQKTGTHFRQTGARNPKQEQLLCTVISYGSACLAQADVIDKEVNCYSVLLQVSNTYSRVHITLFPKNYILFVSAFGIKVTRSVWTAW